MDRNSSLQSPVDPRDRRTTSHSAATSATARRKGALWKRVLLSRRLRRLAIVVVVLGGVGYVSLPLWFPTQWVKTQLARELSRAFSFPAEIGAISISWREGLVIRDVVLRDARTRGGCVLSIERIQSELTPLRWILAGGLETIELHRPTLFVQIHGDGSLNISTVRPQPGLTLKRCRMRDAVLRLIHRTDRNVPSLHVGNLDLRLNPDDGSAQLELADGRLFGDARRPTPDGVWKADADFVLARSPTESLADESTLDAAYTGEFHFEWERLDLASIPIQWLSVAADLELSGQCAGEVRASKRGAFAHDFELSLRLHDVGWRHSAGAKRTWSSCHVEAAGRWSPEHDAVSLATVLVDLPGIRLASARRSPMEAPDDPVPAVEWSPRSNTPLKCRIHATSDDLAAALRTITGHAAGSDMALSGGAELDLDWVYANAAHRIDMAVNGRDTAIDLPGTLHIEPHQPLSATASLHFDETGAIVALRSLEATVGRIRLLGSAELTRTLVGATGAEPTAWSWWEAFRAAADSKPGMWRQAEVRIESQDLSELQVVLPALRRQFRRTGSSQLYRMSGTGSAELQWVSDDGASRLQTQVRLAEDAHVAVGPFFRKTAGKAFAVDVSAAMAGDDWITPLEIAVRYGEGRLTLGEGRLQDRSADPVNGSREFEFSSQVRVDRMEQLLPLTPAARDWLNGVLLGADRLGGAFHGDLVARWQLPPGSEWFGLDGLHVECRLNASDVYLNAPPTLIKPAGSLLTVQLRHTFDPASAQSLHRLEIDATSDAVRLQSELTAGGEYVNVDAELEVISIARALSYSPAASTWLQPRQPQGTVRAQLTASTRPDGRRLRLMCDASDAAFTIWDTTDQAQAESRRESHPLYEKRPATPLTVFVDLHEPASPRGVAGDSNTPVVWRVGRSGVEAAGCRLEIEGGRVELDRDHLRSTEHLTWDAWPRWIKTSQFQGTARIDFTRLQGAGEGTWLDPLKRLELNGVAQLDWDCRLTPETARLSGRLAAEQAAWRIGSSWHKGPGELVRCRWDATLGGWRALWSAAVHADSSITGSNYPFRMEQFELTVPGARLQAAATGAWDLTTGEFAWSSAGRAWRGDVDLALYAYDLSRLASQFSAGPVRPWSGALGGRLRLSAAADGWALDSARLRFRQAGFRLADEAGQNIDELILNGSIRATPTAVYSDGCSIRLGENDLTFQLDVSAADGDLTTGLRGRFDCTANRLDFGALEQQLLRWRASAPADLGATVSSEANSSIAGAWWPVGRSSSIGMGTAKSGCFLIPALIAAQ